MQGAAGDFVGLGLDLAHAYQPAPAFDGALVLTPNAVLVGFVVLGAGGTGSWSTLLPNTPVAQAQEIVGQGISLVGSALVLTAPAITRTQ